MRSFSLVATVFFAGVLTSYAQDIPPPEGPDGELPPGPSEGDMPPPPGGDFPPPEGDFPFSPDDDFHPHDGDHHPDGIFPPPFGWHKHHNGSRNGTGHGGGPCMEFLHLTKLTELANNQTKLDMLVEKGRLDTARVDKIKADAANATTELETLKSNTTLVTECEAVGAHMKTKMQCKMMHKLKKLSKLSENQTAVDEIAKKREFNDTQKAKFQEKIANASTKLEELSGNSTLTNLCETEFKRPKDKDDEKNNENNPEQSTGGASSLMVQSIPYVFIPALASVFMLFL